VTLESVSWSFILSGKSALLTTLTGVQSETAAFGLATLIRIPGIPHHNDVSIQLVDLLLATAKSTDHLDAPHNHKGRFAKGTLRKQKQKAGGNQDLHVQRASRHLQAKGCSLIFHTFVDQSDRCDRDWRRSVFPHHEIYNADVVLRLGVSDGRRLRQCD